MKDLRDKKFLLISVSYIVVFAIGYTIAQKTTHTEKSTKEETTTDTSNNTKKEITEIEETKPDGSKKRTTTIVEETNSEKKKTKETSSHEEKTVTPVKKTLHISALAGLDTSRNFTPVYGASVSKEILGPITIGAFGLTNGTVGISAGITF